MVPVHNDLVLVVKHVEKGQTPQKLKQSHGSGPDDQLLVVEKGQTQLRGEGMVPRSNFLK